MNYKKLCEWVNKIQMEGKPSLNYIFRDDDGTFSAFNAYVGFNVPSLPEGIPFREEAPFHLANKLKSPPANSCTCVIFGRTLRGNNMRIYMDTETAQIITEQELRTEFYDLRAEQPETYGYSFECYVRNCCGKNGFLQEMSEDAVRYAVVSLILGGAGQRAREVVRAWKDVKYVIMQ